MSSVLTVEAKDLLDFPKSNLACLKLKSSWLLDKSLDTNQARMKMSSQERRV